LKAPNKRVTAPKPADPAANRLSACVDETTSSYKEAASETRLAPRPGRGPDFVRWKPELGTPPTERERPSHKQLRSERSRATSCGPVGPPRCSGSRDADPVVRHSTRLRGGLGVRFTRVRPHCRKHAVAAGGRHHDIPASPDPCLRLRRVVQHQDLPNRANRGCDRKPVTSPKSSPNRGI
jgi:hypothetical protein